MTILLMANHFNTGGITSYVTTLAGAFTADGHKVIVISSGGDMVPALEAIGVRHVGFPFNIKSEIHPLLFWNAPALARFVTEEGIDIMHPQTRVTQMAAALVSWSTKVPYVSTCHGFFRPHMGRRLLPLWGRRVIAISRSVKEHLVNDLAAPQDRIVLVPNGIDLSRFVPAEDTVRRSLREERHLVGGPLIGMIARLSDVKGHACLIDAMPLILARFPSLKCLFFGQGPLEGDLKNRVAALGLTENILFYPVVGRTADVLPLLDIFVAPSVQEGLGLSVLEAAAMEIPCVASRVGGLLDAVDDRRTGILVDPQNPEALAAGIMELLSDAPRTRAMGKAAREWVQRQFSATLMAQGTRAVYRDVLENRI